MYPLVLLFNLNRHAMGFIVIYTQMYQSIAQMHNVCEKSPKASTFDCCHFNVLYSALSWIWTILHKFDPKNQMYAPFYPPHQGTVGSLRWQQWIWGNFALHKQPKINLETFGGYVQGPFCIVLHYQYPFVHWYTFYTKLNTNDVIRKAKLIAEIQYKQQLIPVTMPLIFASCLRATGSGVLACPNWLSYLQLIRMKQKTTNFNLTFFQQIVVFTVNSKF